MQTQENVSFYKTTLVNLKDRDVTTVFAYSHANSSPNQSERA